MSEVIGQGTIVVKADATQLKAGIEDAKRSVRNLGKEMGDSVKQGGAQATRSIDAYIKRVEFSASAIGKSQREVKLLELSQRGATADQLERANAALTTIENFRKQQQAAREASEAARRGAQQATGAQLAQGNATKLTAYQTQQLTFQLNDLFVQLASGASPVTALIQQGSQLNGTFGGFGGTLRALGSLLTPTRIAVGSVATAVGGLAIAYAKGNQESAAFNRSLLLTGNAAGLTEGRYNQLARAIAAGTQTTVGSTRETLAALVAGGQLGSAALEKAGVSVQLLAKVTGQSAEEIAKQFATAADNPVRFAEQLNQSLNFLTAAQYKQIKAASDSGDKQKALSIVFDALNSRLQTASKEVGFLEEAWTKLKNVASGGIDFVLNIGRRETPEETVNSLRQQLSDRIKRGPLGADTAAAYEKGNAALREQIANYESVQREGQKLARISETNAARDKAGIEFAKRQEASMSERAKLAKELNDVTELGKAAGASELDIAKEREEVYKRSAVFEQDRALLAAKLEASLATIRRTEEVAAAQVAREGTEIEARRGAQLLSEQAYFSARRELIQTDAQIRVKALQDERDRIQAQKIMAKDGADAERQQLEKRTRVADLDAKIAIERANTQSKLIVLDVEQEGIVRRLAGAYLEAAQAQISYVDGLRRQQALDLQLAGVGNEERQRLQGRAQILEKYTQDLERIENEREKRRLANNGVLDPKDQTQYERELFLIQNFKAKALQSYDDYTARRVALEGKWETGASESIANYLASVRNIAKDMEGVFDHAFQGMEDALVDFVATGKLNFTSLANSILADITRIIVKQQITGPLAASMSSGMSSGSGFGGLISSFLGSLFGGGAGGGTGMPDLVPTRGGRAIGGPVSARGAYRVGESGAEVLSVSGRNYLLMGEQGGEVKPAQSMAGGGTTVVNNFHLSGPVDRRTQEQIAASAATGARRALARTR